MLDFVICHARIVDGTGATSVPGDLAIVGDRIAAVGRVEGATRFKFDADGQTVAPGFIDIHTHDDRALLASPDMAMKVSQGVTTVVVGNRGVSLAPLTLDGAPPPLDLLGERADFRFERFADHLAALDSSPAAVNSACLVGHSTLRVGCMAALDRPAERAELDAMRGRLREALRAGAIGFSMESGLIP